LQHEDDDEGNAEYFATEINKIPDDFDDMSEIETLAGADLDLNRFQMDVDTDIEGKEVAEDATTNDLREDKQTHSLHQKWIEEPSRIHRRRPLRPLTIPVMNILIMAVGTR
jgi:Asp-tRNA(Asn)/Glu-tRNA(Gln) amidotransferase C subunit